MNSTLFRRAAVSLAAVAVAACGDSTGPRANLSDAQVADMLQAMSSVSNFGGVPGAPLAMVSVSETVSCPNGGSATSSGSVNSNEAAGTAIVQITQSFTGCKATGSEGRVWTFDGNPNVATNLNTSYNATTGAFSITGTQIGGIKFASDLGSGSCDVSLQLSFTGNQTSFNASLSGMACGHQIQQSISFTE